MACKRRAEVPTQRSLFAHASEFRLVHIHTTGMEHKNES